MDERQLERLLREWNPRALARAKRSLYASIVQTCAEDVVQDASLIFVEKLRTGGLSHLSRDGQLFAYFMTVVTHCALRRNASSARHTKRHVSSKTMESVLEELCDEGNTPEALLERLQAQNTRDNRLETVKQNLPKLLSKQQYEFFHLRYIRRKSIDEVARITQRTRQQVDTVLSNARKKLSDILRSESME